MYIFSIVCVLILIYWNNSLIGKHTHTEVYPAAHHMYIYNKNNTTLVTNKILTGIQMLPHIQTAAQDVTCTIHAISKGTSIIIEKFQGLYCKVVAESIRMYCIIGT